ncbi:MAG: transcription antitermination factor NusB [Gemmatimonadetes bacterium]|nr:transcription antitermination factor NusB [Gemmatimonadota bacterium]
MSDRSSGRSLAREFALSVLFASQFHESGSADEIYGDLLRTLEPRGPIDEHAKRLIETVLLEREEIDAAISPALRGWSIDRLATVDRWVLRIGVCELLFFGEVPAGVVIDEAVELAKRFGGPRSGTFVNGVLDGVRRGKSSSALNDQSETA